MKNFFIVWLLLLSVFSCTEKEKTANEKPVARVSEKYLYESDINSLITKGMSKDDSIIVVRNYIDDWIRKQLMLEKAELKLTDESLELEKLINDYRSSLLIFKYQQELINQKLDTIVSDEEVEDYYNEYSSNFILTDNIVKVLYIKLSKEAPEILNVKQWYKSSSEESFSKLENHCYQYATKFDNFNDEWVPFDYLLAEIPIVLDDQERFLKYQKYIETEDDLYYYLVKINDYRLKSSVQPLEYATAKIKNIILNKRKFTLIQELENSVYNEALSHNKFTIY